MMTDYTTPLPTMAELQVLFRAMFETGLGHPYIANDHLVVATAVHDAAKRIAEAPDIDGVEVTDPRQEKLL